MKTIIASVLVGSALSTPVLAQSASDSFNASETRQIVMEYGACVVRKAPALASQAILTRADERPATRRRIRLVDAECMPVKGLGDDVPALRHEHFNYALADALVRREFTGAPLAPLGAVPALNHQTPAVTGLTPASVGRQAAYGYISSFGECVVRANPAGAHALLMAAPDSQAEAARFSALRPVFASCLPQGRSLEFSKLVLRGTIAVNYYRLAVAARGISSGAIA